MRRRIQGLLDGALRLIRRIEPLWRRFRELRAVLRPAWFAGFVIVIIAVALQVAQARDVLVQIASESLGRNLRGHGMLLASALLAAFAGWYFPRGMLYVRYHFTPADSQDRYEPARRWLPRLLGALPLLSLGVASWRSGLTGYGFFYLLVAVLFVGALILRRLSPDVGAGSFSTTHFSTQVRRSTGRPSPFSPSPRCC